MGQQCFPQGCAPGPLRKLPLGGGTHLSCGSLTISSLLPDPTWHPSVSHSMGCFCAPPPPAGYCLKSSACRIAARGPFSPVQALSPSLWGTPKCSKGLDLYREKVRSVLLMPRSKRDKINSTVYRCLLRKSEYPEKQGNDYCTYQCGRQLRGGGEGTVTAGTSGYFCVGQCPLS